MNENSLTAQIYAHLRQGITGGLYVDRRLPTEKELSEQFFVSRITARNALLQLVSEGLIVRIKGKGSFVKGSEVIPGVARQASSRPGVIALVMGGYTPSFGVDIFRGALAQAQALGYIMIVACTDNDQIKESEVIRRLISEGVSGLIVQPVHGESYSKDIVSAVFSGFPVVMLDRLLPGIRAPFVGIDNRLAAGKAADFLLEQGHSSIALLTLTDEKSSTIAERMQGVIDAFERRDMLPNREQWLMHMEERLKEDKTLQQHSLLDAYAQQVQAHMHKHPGINAILGTECIVTRAAVRAVRQQGLQVGKDVLVAGFDMKQDCDACTPLLSVDQPQQAMGREGALSLHRLLTGGKQDVQDRVLEAVLSKHSKECNI